MLNQPAGAFLPQEPPYRSNIAVSRANSVGATPSSTQWLIGFLFLTNWTLLALYDTGLLESLPLKGLIRPVLLALLFAAFTQFTPRNLGASIAPGFAGMLALVAAIGLASNFACDVPLLGHFKLALYVMVLVPLVFYSGAIRILDGTAFNRTFVFFLSFFFMLLGFYRGIFPAETTEFANSNHVSSLAVAALPVALMRPLRLEGTLIRNLKKLVPLLVVAICILNHSRGALGGAFAFLLVWASLRRRPDFLYSIFFSTLVFTFVAIVYLLLEDTLKEFLLKGDDKIIDDHRQNEIDLFWRYFSEKPFLGYGFGLSWRVRPEHFERVLRDGRMSMYIGEFGNSSIAAIIGGGVILFSALALTLLVAIQYAFRGLAAEFNRAGTSPLYQNMVLLVAGLAGMFVNSQTEGWFMSPMTFPTFTFWLYLGAVLQLAYRAHPPRMGYT